MSESKEDQAQREYERTRHEQKTNKPEYKKTSVEFPHMVGEKVWLMCLNKAVEGKIFKAYVAIPSQIKGLKHLPNKYTFDVDYGVVYKNISEHQIFHSKQELLTSL